MKWQEYSVQTASTAVYPPETAPIYLVYGFKSEVGEIFGRLKKTIRGDQLQAAAKERLLGEIGDCYWYLSELFRHFGYVPLCERAAAPTPCQSFGCHPANITIDPLVQLDALAHQLFVYLHDGHVARNSVQMAGWLQLTYDCLGRVALMHDFSAEDCMSYNANKLAARKSAGTLKGDGDVR